MYPENPKPGAGNSPLRQFRVRGVSVHVYEHKSDLGRAAARHGAGILREAIAARGSARIIVGTGPSQNETIDALVRSPDLSWDRVEVFHMDEYVGLPASHPASFRRWLKTHLADIVRPGRVHYLEGDAGDPEAECRRYGDLLRSAPMDISFIGFGENGHIAFNDPGVADFEDRAAVKRVVLDERCRLQQVGEGHFPDLASIPPEAITITCSLLVSAAHLVCSVPDRRKAEAVRNAIQGPLSERCPASLVLMHPRCVIFLDTESASLLNLAALCGSQQEGNMPFEKNSALSRRDVIAGGGAALASVVASFPGPAQQRRLRLAQVGTGSRGTHWGRDLIQNYADVIQIVGLCDINAKRAEVAKEMIGSSAPTFIEFDRMVEETKPQVILVTTTDSSHYTYIIRAMQLGLDVITEKPLCTDEQQCQAILDAEKQYRRKLTVAFNARHYPQAKKVKQLLLEKAIGEVISVDYQEYLDIRHGASYFRRWHRIKENSGTLLVSKSCHHFDQVNWWAGSVPVEVMAWGDLRFYGKNHSVRGTHCRGCPYKPRCEFYWDVTKDAQAMKLYVACEAEDGYQIDGCVWRQDTNICDTFSVMTRYENGVRLTYTANTFMPYEGQEIGINGSKGRIDFNMYDAPGYSDHVLRLTRNFGKSKVIREEEQPGGHGGADPSVRHLIFRGANEADPLGLQAGSLAGAYSSLVGIAGYRSIERGGERVRIASLVKL